ncbi:MAG: Phosphoglycerate mutase [Edaphobacter sp.]|nr:Phosphoglycerate mutase [Edaphobacter sp.]
MTNSSPQTTTRIILVRHGQSVANAGGVPDDHISNPLTELGWEQAKSFAEEFSCSPTLFIRSSFLRAQQTSEPLLKRFPEVPVEEWPIHEFTYLEPTRHNGTAEEQQLPHIHEYWARRDPAYIDGPNAESFSLFLGRARDAIKRLIQLPPSDCVVVFTHGLLMQAIRLLLLFPDATDTELMLNFRRFHATHFINNVDSLEFEVLNHQIRMIDQQHLTSFTLEGEPSHV